MRLMILLSLLTILPANAGEINFSAVITNIDGQPIPDCVGNDCDNKPPLTLGAVAIKVLTFNFPDEEKTLSGEEKFKRGELALRLYKSEKSNLTAEDIALIKKLVGKAYGPLVVTRAWSLLDPSQK